MTWNEETTKVLEDDLRDMLRIQSCKATQHIPGVKTMFFQTGANPQGVIPPLNVYHSRLF